MGCLLVKEAISKPGVTFMLFLTKFVFPFVEVKISWSNITPKTPALTNLNQQECVPYEPQGKDVNFLYPEPCMRNTNSAWEVICHLLVHAVQKTSEHKQNAHSCSRLFLPVIMCLVFLTVAIGQKPCFFPTNIFLYTMCRHFVFVCHQQ